MSRISRGKYYTGDDKLPLSEVLGDYSNGYNSASEGYSAPNPYLKANSKNISDATFGQSGSLSSDDDGKIVVKESGDKYVIEAMQDLSVSGM